MGPIAVDPTNARLYVADPALAAIFWFQLAALPDGRLVTDGRKHTGIITVDAKALEVDGAGNLYVGGYALIAVTPSMPAPPMSIMKFSFYQLTMGDTAILNTEGIWNVVNSGNPPKMFNPSTMVSDGSRIFWGNADGGGTHGTILEAPVGGGGADAIKVHVDQGDKVGSVAFSPEYLFYSTENGIFGVSLYKKEQGCGKPASTEKKAMNPSKLSLKAGAQQGPCHKITSDIALTKGMVWDGDGTMFTVDPESGIYSFPSGNIEEHQITKLVDFVGLETLDMLWVSFGSISAAPSVFCMVMLVAAIQFQM